MSAAMLVTRKNIAMTSVKPWITGKSRLMTAFWGKLQAGELAAVPIRDRVANTSTIDAVTHVSRQLPLAAEEFLRAVQGELQALRNPKAA